MSQLKLIICTLSILLNLIVFGYVTHKIISRYDNRHKAETNWLHLSRKSLFEILPEQQNKTIFLGASIIQYGEWSELLEQPAILNRGIAGDTTHDILLRLKEVTKNNPSQLLIMVGLNDIMEGATPQAVAGNLTTILQLCLTESPASSLQLLSILPVARQLKNAPRLNAIIEETNILYQDIAQQYHIRFISLGDAVQDKDGYLNQAYTIDGIHLTGQGYQAITKALKPYLTIPEPDDMPEDTRTKRYPDAD